MFSNRHVLIASAVSSSAWSNLTVRPVPFVPEARSLWPRTLFPTTWNSSAMRHAATGVRQHAAGGKLAARGWGGCRFGAKHAPTKPMHAQPRPAATRVDLLSHAKYHSITAHCSKDPRLQAMQGAADVAAEDRGACAYSTRYDRYVATPRPIITTSCRFSVVGEVVRAH